MSMLLLCASQTWTVSAVKIDGRSWIFFGSQRHKFFGRFNRKVGRYPACNDFCKFHPAQRDCASLAVGSTGTVVITVNNSLEVNGINFLVNSIVKWDDTPLVTTFVSSTRLNATVPASLLGSTGTVVITVTNSGPGGGVSSGLDFNIVHPAPSLKSFEPPQVLMRIPQF